MSTPRLYTVFEYLATLIAERGENEPFMLSQLQPALKYKFPDFSFEEYQISGLKEFIVSGETAGYFKLVNTGSAQTAYLMPGAKRPQVTNSPAANMVASAGEMGVNDPRRTRWMTLAMENMLSADRADQIIDAIRGTDALSNDFDTFLEAQMNTATLYATRGKLKRLRDFLTALRTKGEGPATSTWQVSRSVLRMPPTPPVEGAGRAQSLIWALLQGSKTVSETPLESFDDFFFAVLNFSREQMAHNRSWDWVEGLTLLDTEVRAIPRPVAKKTGLFGKSQAPEAPTGPDEARIAALTEHLREASGIAKAKSDDIPTWTAFVQTPSLDTSFRFIDEHPALATDERILVWLEEQISGSVAAGNMDAVRNLANKAALIIAVRQSGLDGVRQNLAELKSIYTSVMEGAKQLSVMFGFLNAAGPTEAAHFFEQHPELADESIGPLIEDQMIRSAHHNDVTHYRLISERLDLWHNLANFGVEQGKRQHEHFLASARNDQHIQAEMGLMLLSEATDPEVWQDIIARYPSVATQQGLNLANHTLEVLSFQNADQEVYNRHFEVKRLIERCLELGIDRALSEMK